MPPCQAGPDPAQLDISIIVPSLNEAENLPALAERIDAALVGRSYEILIVDDASIDDTRAVCSRLSERYPLRLHVRGEPVGGLSGAVLLGLQNARGQYLVVMDADLQHPPERIPDLLLPLESGQADFVLGSRYVPGGSTDGQWGPMRRINSRVATLLARPFAGGARDPMSGFFALPRRTFQKAEQLDPIGYKIALELMCKCRVRRVAEVPIHFALRGAGTSKLTMGQQLRYLDHLRRLWGFCFPRSSAAIKFVAAEIGALLFALALYGVLARQMGGGILASAMALATAAGVAAVFEIRLRRRRTWPQLAGALFGQWAVCALAAFALGYAALHAGAPLVFALVCLFGIAGHLILDSPVLRQLGSFPPGRSAQIQLPRPHV